MVESACETQDYYNERGYSSVATTPAAPSRSTFPMTLIP